MSIKYQITLPEPLADEMRVTAAKLKIPLAQFIRETVEDKLRELKAQDSNRRPLEWMEKLRVDIPDTDLASRIDEILYK
ncbi:MAG TPA: hypothetical protein VNH83_30725 [Bryobacteraceae bacterium]|nr:hypothetical protein [Bryobacteraceae bacterium]